MAKLAYYLGAYQNYRIMIGVILALTGMLVAVLCIVYYDKLSWDSEPDDDDMVWLKRVIKTSVVLFIFNLLAVVYTPTILSMEEMIIEKAARIETNTKSNDELRLYFNNIIGHGHNEEKEKDKNETN